MNEKKLKELFFDLCGKYEWCEDIVSALRSSDITDAEYHYIQCNWRMWLNEWQQEHPDTQWQYFE